VLETLPGTAAAGVAPPPLDIATDRCKGCELCVSACPKHVLALDLAVVNALGRHPIRLLDPDACTSCALCVRVCPDVVFTVYARAKGS
jgi:2-oxoglutarate ferredoxin oxidoreductase subunit delta